MSCVAFQLIVTLMWRAQLWSMALGMGLLALLCAVASNAAIPTADAGERWRWRLMAIGFVFWSMAWIVSAYSGSQGIGDQPVAKLAIVRQLIFIAALLPIGEAGGAPVFRTLDAAQGLIFSTLLALMIWPAPFSNDLAMPDQVFSYFGYSVFALLAVVNWLGQPRHAAKALAILFTIYAFTSIAAMEIIDQFGVTTNSPFWIIGDVAFLAFIAIAVMPDRGRHDPLAGTIRSEDRGQIGSLLLTVMVVMIAFAVGRRFPLTGSLAGLAGLLIFAARTSLVQRRYLAARDALIVFERRRSREMIDMVHEIRSPLGSVVLNAAMLGTSTVLTAQEARWVEQIRAGGTRVTTLLNDVLDLERLKDGMIRLDIARHDVVPIIDGAITMVAPHGIAHGISLVHRRDGARWASVDAAKLTRVIVNLLMNAIRFTPRGGIITIDTAATSDRTIVIEIADTGVGIAAEVLDSLFERFSHRGIPINGDRGSGLGLAISRALVNAIDGTLALHSEPGVGTTATITVPANVK